MEYGLLGEKLGHSFSPQIHSRLADYSYDLIEKKPGEVGEFLEERKFQGLNVTIPYKKKVFDYCDQVTELARRIGSINTIANRGGKLYGDNTDYYGFRYMIQRLGVSLQGKKVLILGNGGVAPAVRAALEDEKAGKIVIISRRGEDNYENLSRHGDAQVIVNTTPLGMYPMNGAAAIELNAFPSCQAVYDLIYNPLKTKLLLEAERLGIPHIDGLPMLVAQAKKSSEIFLNEMLPDEKVEEIASDLRREVSNLSLIGMPGCGKSTVGEKVAEKLGKRFVDVDQEIVKEMGREIPVIFQEEGEEGFRAIETRVLRRIAREKGQVIASGGGVVVRPENWELLRQNGPVVFLRRDLEKLPLAGRPISQSKPVEQIYRERIEAYRGWSDYQVENREISEAVDEIRRWWESTDGSAAKGPGCEDGLPH